MWTYCPFCKDRILSDQKLIHDIEEHGIVPYRPPHRGDPVWVTPPALDNFRYRVQIARHDYDCRHCGAGIATGQLHASRPRSSVHYCLRCVDFMFGTPQAAQVRRQQLMQEVPCD